MMANKLRRQLDRTEWRISVVDRDPTHYYQPGFLFVPFGIYKPGEVKRPKAEFLPRGVELVLGTVDVIDPDNKQVRLSEGERVLSYDILIIATGTYLRPDQTEGMLGDGWRRNIFDFYTLDGAAMLGRFLDQWEGGRLLLNVTEMPIKCPVAPLEFLFLADWHFHQRGMRDKVELTYATPLDAAFTKPQAAAMLGDLLGRKNKMGDEAIERSGLGDELNHIPTDKHTLRAKKHEDVFILGDATNLPSSKAGSVAHFQADVLTDNIIRQIEGQDLVPTFDGHANCFIESGFGKGILIDFNYDTEPLPGKFPLPGVGPFSLPEESRMNHWGKMMFRWVYWNRLLKGAGIGVEPQMSMAGKKAA
jgi:sulfide:quinone oxidoreductase